MVRLGKYSTRAKGQMFEYIVPVNRNACNNAEGPNMKVVPMKKRG